MSVSDSDKLAKTYDKLYSDVPTSVSGQSSTSESIDKAKGLKKLLENHIPRSDQKDIDLELKKTVVLTKPKYSKTKTAKPKKKSGKFLTAKERRNLGLFKLPKKSLKYDSFRSMHILWLEYITGLVDLENRRPGDKNTPMRLCRADYHGALVKVTKSKSQSLLGVEGFIVVETRSTFQIIGKDDVLKIIPKSGTTFSVRIKDHLVHLEGSSLIMKPTDRAVRKWKNKPPLDF